MTVNVSQTMMIMIIHLVIRGGIMGLKKIRNEQNISLGKLAELTGLSLAGVFKAEKTKCNNATVKTLKKMAVVLKCNWWDLVD